MGYMDAHATYKLLPDGAESDEILGRLQAAYAEADAQSLAAARQYRWILALLAAAGTMLTMAFLLYDEAELIWMIFVCGVMLACEFCLRRASLRLGCHERFIEQRVLAEALRVQTFLRYAGSGLRVSELMTWTQRTDTAWVGERVDVLLAGAAAFPAHDIARCWVEDQRSYHERAERRGRVAYERAQRTVRVALVVSVALYVGALLFELAFGEYASASALSVEQIAQWRAWIKIALGTASAATLFVSSYYDRQSMGRVVADHAKMASFFAHMGERLAEEGQSEDLLAELAREELIENGNWYSYQLDNAPDLSL